MRDKQDDHLDALIDDTARAMTDATPPVLLRAAVRQRIERPARGLLVRRSAWREGGWQAGFAAASIVLVAFIAGRAWLGAPSEAPPLARATVGEVVATAPPVTPANDAVSSRVADAPRTAVVRRVAASPLPPAEPIAIEPLVLELVVDPMVLAVDAIAVPMPLDIMPIVVEPISMQ